MTTGEVIADDVADLSHLRAHDSFDFVRVCFHFFLLLIKVTSV